ncbi:hypothetical protein [Tenacibaculum sp. C7A-26P2]|uniref:hypothetical protein n=1 Tax=Tenacibaculum sp. C7A-26P2 TaxID=3447504 RepID=UPI003F856B31
MIFKKLKNKGLIVFLLSLVTFIGLLAYQNSRDFNILKATFENEKQQLEEALKGAINQSQNFSSENHNFSVKMKDQLEIIKSLQDTILTLKASRNNLIKRCKNLACEKTNKPQANNKLTTENKSIKTKTIKSNNLYNFSKKKITPSIYDASSTNFDRTRKKREEN